MLVMVAKTRRDQGLQITMKENTKKKGNNSSGRNLLVKVASYYNGSYADNASLCSVPSYNGDDDGYDFVC